jgi:hypothetical protein
VLNRSYHHQIYHQDFQLTEEINESPQVFIVEDSYRIENGFIIACENSESRPFLQPSEHPELPARLSDLHDREEQDVLEFTSEYGLLGYTEMYLESLSSSQKNKFSESGEKWGDRIDWILSHSSTIHNIITLLDLMKQGDSSNISEFLEWWKSESRHPLSGLGISYMAGVSQKFFRINPLTQQQRSEELQTITRIINSNTSPYISEILYESVGEVGPVIRSYKSKVLLPLVYRHLGDLAIGLIKYYKCGYRKCSKRWPEKTDGRGPKNQYCPPEIGKASLCSRNEGYYRSKDKKEGVK